MALLLYGNRKLGTIGHGEAGLVFESGWDESIIQFERIAEVIDIKQFGSQGVTAVVTLALGGVNVNTHDHSVDAKLVKFIMGAIDFIILLPPSEGKTPGGDRTRPWTPTAGTFGATLGAARTKICTQLSALDGGDARLLGVKGAHLERAQSSNAALIRSASLPAWQRFSGVVWEHLNLASLPTGERNKILRRIFVPSGMAGLLRADDPLPDYRLKMGARLTDLGLLSTWWRPLLTSTLAAAARSRVIVDLLPNEHRAAFEWTDLPTTVRIDLVSKSGAVVGGHNAKAAKGRLARHLLTSSGTDLRRMVSSFKDADYSARITTRTTKGLQ